MRKSFTLFILSGAIFSSLAWSAPEPEKVSLADSIQLKVEKFTMANGLTVILTEDHSAPFFTYQQWFRVGSKYEKPGLTGLAHFFEHLMFKGTKKYPPHTIEKVLASNGGSFNAFTSHDYTGYYFNLPAGKLELAIDLDSDRMRNLLFDPAAIQSEREVVKEERRMRVDNDIFGTLSEKVYRTVFKVHPYHWPVIGSMIDLNRASTEDMRSFYNIYYAPNNAVVVIAGDFDSANAKRLLEKYYGKIPSQVIPKLTLAPEPEQTSERQAVIAKDVQNVTVSVSFKIVKAGDPDNYPLDLAATILGQGKSSRLYRKLVYQQQVATSVSVESFTPGDPGIFSITISLKPGQNVDSVLNTVYAEIYKLRTHPVTDLELEKAKNGLMKDYVFGLMTVYGKAKALAIHEIYFNDYREMFKDLDRYTAVSKEQIIAVTDKYLKPQQRSVVRVVPQSAAAPAVVTEPVTPPPTDAAAPTPTESADVPAEKKPTESATEGVTQ